MRRGWNAEVNIVPPLAINPYLLTWLPRNRDIKEIGHNCCTGQCFCGNPFPVNICAFVYICMTHTYVCVKCDWTEVGGAVGLKVRGVVKLAAVQAHIS